MVFLLSTVVLPPRSTRYLMKLDMFADENCEKFNPSLEMGPLTLRDYVRTLEPYDPQRHGWRGNEPRPVSREIVIKNFDNSSETLLSSSPFKTALPPTHHINTSSTNNHIISSPLAGQCFHSHLPRIIVIGQSIWLKNSWGARYTG